MGLSQTLHNTDVVDGTGLGSVTPNGGHPPAAGRRPRFDAAAASFSVGMLAISAGLFLSKCAPERGVLLTVAR